VVVVTGASVIIYQVESYSAALDDLKEIYPEHYEELAANKSSVKLNVNYAKYSQLESLGMLHLVTVRKDGLLAGYHLSMISPHLHYVDSLTCFTDIFFVRQQYRKEQNGMIGLKLFKFMEESLREKGVQRIYMGTKLHLDIGPILERLGYSPIERLYTKMIG